MSRQTWILIAVIGGIFCLLTLWGAIKLGKRLFVTKRLLDQVGAGGKWAFYGALIYTFLPIDLLPDPIYLDDMGVLAAALVYLTSLLRKRGVKLPLPRSRHDGSERGARR
ncbi:YkvA family protein [Catellatospora tritici]|uniref:YkvA family protein n=1 Tax=Catellatospora tritici TaxID=2851566 RepID=UPI001C2CCD88|nr:YkvA family protein [Catellatospora tritici]MBV1852690.1 DUF1232 domain-containing protein [Catellatospora tritici]